MLVHRYLAREVMHEVIMTHGNEDVIILNDTYGESMANGETHKGPKNLLLLM